MNVFFLSPRSSAQELFIASSCSLAPNRHRGRLESFRVICTAVVANVVVTYDPTWMKHTEVVFSALSFLRPHSFIRLQQLQMFIRTGVFVSDVDIRLEIVQF